MRVDYILDDCQPGTGPFELQLGMESAHCISNPVHNKGFKTRREAIQEIREYMGIF
jgi:hypothetical protein